MSLLPSTVSTFLNISFLLHFGLSHLITYQLWDRQEYVYFGLSISLLGAIYLSEFLFFFIFYISMTWTGNEEITPCLIFTGLLAVLTCGFCVPSHYLCCILSRRSTSKYLICLSFIPSIIPIAIISIFSPFLLCIYLYYVTDDDIQSMIIISQLIVISCFTILHFLIICNYYLSSWALTCAFLLAMCHILMFMFTQITSISHYAFKLSCCCEFILLVWYLLLGFMVKTDAFLHNQSFQEWIVLIACLTYLFPNIPFLPTVIMYKYLNGTTIKLYYPFLFENNKVDANIVDKLYSIIHIATHSYNSLGFKSIHNEIPSKMSSHQSIKSITPMSPTLPISPLLVKKCSESEKPNDIDITITDGNDELMISKHDALSRICYEYQYEYMKLNNTEKKQYINAIIGHQSVFRRIIFWFSPDDNLLTGICVWISLNMLITVGVFCHFFPMFWFGYIYIYHINYLAHNHVNSPIGITNWLSDEYDNYQHLLITTVTLIYVVLIGAVIPFLINLIKQIHYTGYISKILTSGHDPSLHNVQTIYETLERNVVVMDCIGNAKIVTIILSFIDNTDIKRVRYNDNRYSIGDSIEYTNIGSVGLEIKS